MSESPAPSQTSRQQEVIAEHLPPGYGLGFDGAAGSSTQTSDTASASKSSLNLAATPEESSLKLQGGDIHRHLFKISAKGGQELHRSKTFSHPSRDTSEEDIVPENVPPIDEMMRPQGFRRQYIMQRYRRLSHAAPAITRDFVEFLDLYGSFAGEDLADSDEEAVEEEEEEEEGGVVQTEATPLLSRRKSARRERKGDAGTVKTFFTTLKAFIGTGIMFLPKAFKNGGILFSSITMVLVAAVSMLAFHLLLQCRAKYGGSYGDLGREIAGPKMRTLILASVTLSQICFVCAGLVFVADNWASFFRAVVSSGAVPGTKALIAIQAVLIIPLSFIRNISKLGPAALLADVFIMLGIGYIYYYDISSLATRGIAEPIALFNPKAYTLTLGASIFTFEGIGLILPIQSSMRKPHHFEPLLGMVMLLITLIFTSVGALCYATFGPNTKIEVIDNFPQDNRLVNAVQFTYALAVLVGNPVQLFPAMRIIESKIFGHRVSGKKDPLTKWKKNAFRTSLVALCVGIAIAGSQDLDRFVALIGSFACIPLVYLYPAYLHYKGVAESRWAKAGDVVMMVVGAVCMVFSTTVTIMNSFM